MAKRPRNTIKFVEKERTEKVFVAQVPELVPLPEEGRKEERAILASEILMPGQHNNMPKKINETIVINNKGVGRPSAQMELGGR